LEQGITANWFTACFQCINTFRAAWFRRFSHKKTAVFGCLTNAQRPSSSAHCARELFSSSNRLASL